MSVGGAECSVIRADLLSKYFPTILGRVALRPFCGESVAADVIRLYVSLTFMLRALRMQMTLCY